MQIDRATLERELAAVRAQAQQASNVLHQATGAEKAFMAMLTILDSEEAEAASLPPAKRNGKSHEGATQ